MKIIIPLISILNPLIFLVVMTIYYGFKKKIVKNFSWHFKKKLYTKNIINIIKYYLTFFTNNYKI
jgi:hypothetical protein